MGDIINDEGKPWSTHENAPLGAQVNTDFHTYFSYYWYKFLQIIKPDVSILTAIFFVPVIIASLAVIPMFFIGRRLAGNLGGFLSSTIVAIHASILGRTPAGFADTDGYNVLFPLLIAWVFMEALYAKDWRKKVGFSILTGFLLGLFAYAWVGFWYVFDFIFLATAASIIFFGAKYYRDHQSFKGIFAVPKIKWSLITLGIYALSSFIFVSLFKSAKLFIDATITGPFGFTFLKDAAKANLWPNVYTTVAELNPASLNNIVSHIGGKTMFVLAALGFICAFLKKEHLDRWDWSLLAGSTLVYLYLVSKSGLALTPISFLFVLGIPVAAAVLVNIWRKYAPDTRLALIFFIWFAGTIYAGTKGIRFVLLMVPAYAVGLALFFGFAFHYIVKISNRELKIPKKWVSLVLVIIICLFVLYKPVKAAEGVAMNEVPSMSDAWWQSLEEIKMNSNENAVINSWWDFGHWFKAVADRPVTFDGGSQNTPPAHWIGKSLLTDSEDMTLGILRMMDCGSRRGFEVLEEEVGETVKTINIINEIIVLPDENDAKEILLQHVSSEKADEVLKLTHCSPPENFYITSADMVGKAGVWAHFGSWDFKRAYLWRNAKGLDAQSATELLTQNVGYSQEEAENLYWDAQGLLTENQANSWISPWPSYVTGGWSRCGNTTNETTGETLVICNFNVKLNDQGLQETRFRQAIIPLDNPEDSSFYFGTIDKSTGSVLGGGEFKVAGVALALDEEITRVPMENVGYNMDLLISQDGSGFKSLILDPRLTQSTFTKLFFLEGAYMPHFVKFSDKTSFTGGRIIVWKVDWQEYQ